MSLTKDHNITTGKVYKTVIDKERKGNYLGKTVQVVPHITNEIMDWLQRVAPVPVDDTGLEADVCLVEVGGTVGEIESMVFLEALRQFQFRVGRENMCFVHVSLVPTLGGDHEQKTKPTQHGVKELRSVGLSPDMIICRSSDQLQPATCHKIALFCHVAPERVLSVFEFMFICTLLYRFAIVVSLAHLFSLVSLSSFFQLSSHSIYLSSLLFSLSLSQELTTSGLEIELTISYLYPF